VSGDFYDFFQLPDGRIAFCLGDVSGKGINAALLMAKTASLYRCLGKEETSPGRLLARINDEIFETATRGMFVTLIGGIYNPATDRLCFANAGHEPPLYQGRDGSFTDFPADAPPLGILPAAGERLAERELALGGGAFYVFTDGLTEGRRADGERLGVQGVKWALIKRRHRPLDDRIQALAKLVERDDGAYHDDVTLLGIDGTRPTTAQADEDKDEKLDYRFAAKAEHLQGARAAVREFLAAHDIAENQVNDVVLAVDEANQNIIRHAYGGAEGGDIVIEMALEGAELEISIRDFAPPIDPTTVAPRALDDIRPGGLGTHFMRSIMDDVAYLRPTDGNGNLLRMRKRVRSS
jgi:sigma-B regulation protein RsbU (phosphoserine phosphatase)